LCYSCNHNFPKTLEKWAKNENLSQKKGDFSKFAVLNGVMTKPSLPRGASVLLLSIFLALPLALHAQDDGPKTPLAKEMQGIAKDFRSLRKMVGNPAQKDAAVQLVKDMEAHAAKARDLEPAKTKSIPPADKDQFVSDYKKSIDGLIGDMQKLEQAVSAGQTADATSLMDKIQSDKREGHHKFNAEDEHHGPGGSHGSSAGGPPPAPPTGQ
jgi:soluble cytochrome b562